MEGRRGREIEKEDGDGIRGASGGGSATFDDLTRYLYTVVYYMYNY